MPVTSDSFDDYLVLKPDQINASELVRLLYNGKVGDIDSIECPEGTVIDEVERRWLVFLSLLLQKILLLFAKPLNKSTAMNLYLMNLVAANGGFFKLIWRFITGKVVKIEADSESFKSPFAFIDTRVELDKNIKPASSRYYAQLCVMAAKLTYENEARIRSIVTTCWNMEFLGFFNCWEDYQASFCTQAFMMSDKPVEEGEAELIVVAFRGTDDIYDMCTDVDFSWYEIPGVGKVHGGFMKALGLQKNGWPKEIKPNQKTPYAYYTIREELRKILKTNPKAKLLVTGHSLGGSLAVLFPVILKYHEEDWIIDRLEGVYTFGQPRVGDRRLGEFAGEVLDGPKRRYFRFVYGNDLMPRLPFDDNTFMFKHFGRCLYYDRKYNGKEMEEEPNKNYFSLVHFLSKHINAVLELYRSFTIGGAKGPDYNESGTMRMMRTMGLIIPGIPAHSPQDYNNATRLGTFESGESDKKSE